MVSPGDRTSSANYASSAASALAAMRPVVLRGEGMV